METDKKENICRRKIFGLSRGRKKGEGKGGKYKMEYIFLRRRKNREGIGGKYWEKENLLLVTRRTTEKEKAESIWRRKNYFAEEKKKVEGNYWEKEKIFLGRRKITGKRRGKKI